MSRLGTDVLIVGSGPSAAFAVLACQDAGASFTVMSDRPPRVTQAGAFFIHWLPERLGGKPVYVTVFGTGTREGYLSKQWGPSFAGIDSSFPDKGQRLEQWYNSLELNKVWDEVLAIALVGVMRDADLLEVSREYGLVFHTFSSQLAASTRSLVRFPTLTADGQGIAGSNMIAYNGHLGEPHTRTTGAFGRTSIEFPAGTREEVLRQYRGAFKTSPTKVLLRDIHPDTPRVKPDEYLARNVIPLGRFARWDRTLLSHDAYKAVISALAEEMVR